MRKWQIALAIPIVAIVLLIATLYPAEVVEHRDEIVETSGFLERQWVLQSMTSDGQDVVSTTERKITFNINVDNLNGSGGCNSYGGEYDATGEYRINVMNEEGVDQLIGVGGRISMGQITQTEMACPEPGLMEQENLFFTALRKVTAFEVETNRLKLTSQDEQTVLNFVPA
jgi:heat shock protein HslJ